MTTHRETDANQFYYLSHDICYSYGADKKPNRTDSESKPWAFKNLFKTEKSIPHMPSFQDTSKTGLGYQSLKDCPAENSTPEAGKARHPKAECAVVKHLDVLCCRHL